MSAELKIESVADVAEVIEWATAGVEILIAERDALKAERDRLKNDLADALDCKNGTGPSALAMVLSERDRLREALAQIGEVQTSPIGDLSAFRKIAKIARQALGAQ